MLGGRPFPEFEIDGKTPAAQQVYLSIQSPAGCSVVVYASFPRDKKDIPLKQQIKKRRKRANELAGSGGLNLKNTTER